MTAVYALLVGIDRYRAVAPLHGCRNDATAVADMLRARADATTTLSIRELHDEHATRAVVIDALRGHLGQAGPDDTALFWFSGHGSQAPVPGPLWHLEPTGMMQTLLCADSRYGDIPDLYDKELSILLDEVAASGCHLAAVIDSCHSGGATREASAGTRGVPPLTAAPRLGSLLAELRHARPATDDGTGRHVALQACRPFELAVEMPLDGVPHGLFSWALMRAVHRVGATATYRELLTAARCTVEDLTGRQVPQLWPPGPGIADRPFLGGGMTTPRAGIDLRYVRGDWEIDAGSCHGLTVDPAAGETRVAVVGTDPVREAVVIQVHPGRSVVRPLGWTPDPDRQYPIAVSRIPMPATTVAIGGTGADAGDGSGRLGGDVRTAELLRAAVRTAGSGGLPSPWLRLIEPDDTSVAAELWAATPAPGHIKIFDAGPEPVWEVHGTDPRAPQQAVDALQHLAAWRQVKAVTNPLSSLAGAVTIELVPVHPGDRTVPATRPALRADADGAVRLRYRSTQGRWSAPTAFVRLRNHSDRRLYCALLDLTDRFRIHADLFTDYIGADRAGAALDGRPVEFRLPDGREARPGEQARDWLVLVVAEEQFSARPFEMPPLGQPRPAGHRNLPGLTGLLERLGRAATHRDAGPAGAPDHAYDWATTILPVITQVTADPEPPRTGG